MTTVEKIINLVQKSGKTEYVVKKEIGLPNGAFSDWKAGRANPSAEALRKIADYFNVSVDYLLGRTDAPTAAEYHIPPEIAGVHVGFAGGIDDLTQSDIDDIKNYIEFKRAQRKNKK